MPAPSPALRLASPAGRWVLVATVLGSGMAFLDATVVGVALPAIGRDLDADLAALQWVVTGYALTLAAFLLIGGALGDRFGRRRMFLVGTCWFALWSLLCGAAPSEEALVVARLLQGAGAALLTPASLAILSASFDPQDRGRAIGAWSGLTGVAGAIGPLVGGWLIDAVSWRLVFLINLPLATAVVAITVRHVPESRAPRLDTPVDVPGALLAAAGLGGLTYGLIEGPSRGWASPLVLACVVAGVAALVAFVVVESRVAAPMLPLGIFRSPVFSAANAVTLAVYAALGGVLFLLPVALQTVAGYSPLAAGVALLPITALMLLLSPRAGAVADRVGPRLPMTAGPLLVGVGMLLLVRLAPDATAYPTVVLPGLLVLGLGLAAVVAPLTSTVLAAAPPEQAGVASGVNSAVARTAGLLAVAVLPAVAGIGGQDYRRPAALAAGFDRGVVVCAGLAVLGAVVAAATVRGAGHQPPTPHDRTCPLDATPLTVERGSPDARRPQSVRSSTSPWTSPGGDDDPGHRHPTRERS